VEKTFTTSHVARLLALHPALTAAGKAVVHVKIAAKRPAAHSTPNWATEPRVEMARVSNISRFCAHCAGPRGEAVAEALE